jgi:hypothetical protein
MAATLDEIVDALLDNADFEETESLAKAHAFVTAAKRYLILCPASMSDQGSSQSINAQQVHEMMRRATAFISARGGSGGTSVRYIGFSSGSRRR